MSKGMQLISNLNLVSTWNEDNQDTSLTVYVRYVLSIYEVSRF